MSTLFVFMLPLTTTLYSGGGAGQDLSFDMGNEMVTDENLQMAQSWHLPRSRPTSVRRLRSLYNDNITNPIPDANIGVDEIVEAQRPFALKHNVTFGDL